MVSSPNPMTGAEMGPVASLFGSFRRVRLFVALAFVAALAVAIAVFCVPKADLHAALNCCHSRFLDCFFSVYTHVAEFGVWLLGVILFWGNKRRAAFVFVSEILSGVVVQMLKFVFSMPRPGDMIAAGKMGNIPLVEGIALHTGRSFPSGHAASFAVLAFAVCLLSMQDRPTRLRAIATQAACGVLFLAGCYSRIYLSQHFAEDVLVGGVIGFVATAISWNRIMAGRSFRGRARCI